LRIDVSRGTDGAEQAAAAAVESAGGFFSARLLVEGPWLAGRQLTGFSGRWLVRDGLVLTAIALVVPPPSMVARLSI
jgi:hypothetical protein